jgi:ribokinase
MRDVTTIGSATADVFMEISLPLIDYPGTPLGKAIALPFGEKFSADSMTMTTGGNAMNAAVTFRRQGLRVAPCIKVGDDPFGASIIDRLRSEGIERSFVFADGENNTSYSSIFLKKGERSIVNHKGAGEGLVDEDLPLRKMRAHWWYISLPGKSISLLPSLLSYAADNDIRVAFNPSGWHIDRAKAQLLKAVKKVDFLVLNEGEAAELVGIPFSREKEVFRALDDMTPGVVAVTSGSRGAVVSDGSYIYRSGIFKEKKMADRTGAGDAFGSGFVAGLIRSGEECERGDIDPKNIEYAIRLGTANAASVVEEVGASEGALTKRDFDKERRWSRLKIIKTKIS